jgi:hypothetical protein
MAVALSQIWISSLQAPHSKTGVTINSVIRQYTFLKHQPKNAHSEIELMTSFKILLPVSAPGCHHQGFFLEQNNKNPNTLP